MTIRIIKGDTLVELPKMDADSIDSAVTDPPYHLTSMVKRLSGTTRDEVEKNFTKTIKGQKANPHAAMARGFMGKTWDGGDIALRPETWVAVWRVLKPGAHLLAFGGTRTFHRMACAIEDAGFEIRDTIAWMYGSGFPKSHDVSKAIDKVGGRNTEWFPAWLRSERAKIGMSQKTLAELGGFYDKINHGGLVANWELGYGLPSAKQFNKVCELLSLAIEPMEEVERRVLGQRKVNRGVAFTSEGPASLDITEPATPEAAQWQGWGTALKPAMELICVARKPLSERTVAANVLRHGTGAINVDACRIELAGDYKSKPNGRPSQTGLGDNYDPTRANIGDTLGRWPANVCHDGSEEVLAAFPDAPGQLAYVGPKHGKRDSVNCYGDYGARPDTPPRIETDKSAARFFYTSKADAHDRQGSKHPTVKPTDLMRYLVRLVTPPGGTVLDPFCGTGSTLLAADQLQFNAVGIEREPQYVADARRKFERDAGLFADIVP